MGMGHKSVFGLSALLGLLLFMPAAAYSDSVENAAHACIDIGGKADSAGKITVTFTIIDGDPVTISVPIARGKTEKDVVRALKAELKDKLSSNSFTVRGGPTSACVKKRPVVGQFTFSLSVERRGAAGLKAKVSLVKEEHHSTPQA